MEEGESKFAATTQKRGECHSTNIAAICGDIRGQWGEDNMQKIGYLTYDWFRS